MIIGGKGLALGGRFESNAVKGSFSAEIEVDVERIE